MENQLISIQTDALAGQSDADLVQQARTTDSQAALAALYRRYLTPVYRYFYTRTGDVQQAEDLTAQTFVAALAVGVPLPRTIALRDAEARRRESRAGPLCPNNGHRAVTE